MSENNDSPPKDIETATVSAGNGETPLPPTIEEMDPLMAHWERQLDEAGRRSEEARAKLQAVFPKGGAPKYTVFT